MQKRRAAKASGGRNSKSAASASDEVDANQVIGTLLRLFDDLGVVVSQPIAGSDTIDRSMATAHALSPHTSEIGELLTHWHQFPEYLDDKGNPARIKLSGRGASFRRLAKLKAPHVDASFLLAELSRLGAVSMDENKLISVHMRAFPVYKDKRLAAQHTLNVLDGFMKALRHNLNSSPSNLGPLFHCIAWNDRFDSREIPALKIRVKRYGQSFLESFDDWLTRKAVAKKRRPKPGSKRAKVSIGVYLSVESN